MKILLRSGTSIIEDLENLQKWKDIMMGPASPVTYSTDSYGLIIFRSTDILEIRVELDEVAAL